MFRRHFFALALVTLLSLIVVNSLIPVGLAKAWTSETHASSTSGPLEIDFRAVLPVPSEFHEVISATMNAHRGSLPETNRYTVSVLERRSQWAHIVLVPTTVIESKWETTPRDDEIVDLVAKSTETGVWQAYLLNDETTSMLREIIPSSFMDLSQKEPASTFLFPWTNGQYWRKTQGWHATNAIDFAPTSSSNPPIHFAVLAAESGTVTQVCNDGTQAMLRINHGGVTTRYLHLASGTIPSGIVNQSVVRGRYLGQIYNATNFSTPCGWGTGPHLHFETSDTGIAVDGYQISDVANAANNTQFLSSNVRMDDNGSNVNQTVLWDFDPGNAGWSASGWEWQGFGYSSWILDPAQGGDPWIVKDDLYYDNAQYWGVEIRMSSTADAGDHVFWKTTNEPYYSGDKSKPLPVTPDGAARTITIRTNDHAKWMHYISGLRIDPAGNGRPNTVGSNSDLVLVEWVKLLNDPECPTVGITSPTENAYFNGNIALSAMAQDGGGGETPSGVNRVAWDVWYDGTWNHQASISPNPDTSPPFDASFTLPPGLTDQWVNIVAMVWDNQGNECMENRAYRGVYIDRSAPTNPTIANPGCTATSNVWQNTCNDANFTWNGAADAGSGVAGYYYYWGTSSTEDPTTWTTSSGFNPGPVSSGSTYYLRVKTKDNAGNTSSPTTLFVLKYDDTAPTNPTTVGPGCTATSNVWQNTCSDANFTWSGASDADSGVAGYFYYWGISDTGEPATWTSVAGFDPTATVSGDTYYLRVKTKDSAGNTSSSTILFVLKYDGEVPASIADSPLTTSVAPISVDWTVSDPTPGSGVVGTVLWYKYGVTGSWTNTGMSASGAAGTFSFNPAEGYGTYYFATVCSDGAGNMEAGASGEGDTATAYTPTSTGPVQISLEPSSITVATGETFVLDVMVNAGTQQVNAIELYISFDPTLLQVLDPFGSPASSIDADATALNTVLLNVVDNVSGLIRYDAGRLTGTPPTGTFRVAGIRFNALAETSGCAVAFLPDTDVFYNGTSVLGGSSGTMVVIEARCLEGQAALQSHTSSAGYAVSVSVYEPGGTTAIVTYDTVLDSNSRFMVCGMTPGTFDIMVKGSHSLGSRRASVNIPPDAVPVNFCSLYEGDASGDNRVSAVDFSILASHYNACTGNVNFDDRADFNDDGCIRGADFSLLASNYNTIGPVICVDGLESSNQLPSSGETQQLKGSVNLILDSSDVATYDGDILTLALAVQAGQQSLNNVEMYVEFDPDVLQVVDVAGNPTNSIEPDLTTLETLLNNSVDNATGRIRYDAGRLTGTPPTGAFRVALVRFKRLRWTEDVPVRIVPPSDVYLNGNSVLGSLLSIRSRQ